MPAALKDRAAEKRQELADEGKRLGDRCVLGFAAPKIDDKGISEPFEALRAGNHIYAGREIVISEADLDRAIENFERYWKPAGGVPVDYDHSFVESGDSTAAGWIVSMERRGTSLYEQVQWTPKAAQQIRDGEYKFYSAEFTSDWINEEGSSEGFTVLAGALTNRPFLRGMTPVALSQQVVEEVGKWTLSHADKLVPGDAPARDETRREVADKTDTTEGLTFTVEIDGKEQEASTFKVEIDGKAQELTAEQVVALHTAKAEADKATAAAEAAKADKDETVTTLSQRVDKLSTELDTERFNASFSQAQREGALDAKPETRTKWERRLEKFGLEATKELLEDLPRDTVPVNERGLDGGGALPGETTVPSDVPEDTDPAMYSLDQRAQQLLREKPDMEGGYRAALSQARAEKDKAAV